MVAESCRSASEKGCRKSGRHSTNPTRLLVEVAQDGAPPPAARVATANAVLDRGHAKPVASLEAKVATMDVGLMHLDALKSISRFEAPHTGVHRSTT